MLVTDIKRKDRYGNETTGFYMDGYLKENLDDIPKFLKEEWDCVGVVSGRGKVRIGKALIKGSKILMSDGIWKNIEDVKINDKIISPSIDGRKTSITIVTAKVEHKNKGIYELRKSNGNLLYSCCSEHNVPVRTLWIKKDKGKKTFVWKDEIYLAEDLANKNEKWYKNHCPKIITSPTITKYDVEDLNINPYLMGLYIGDGRISSKNIIEISNPDENILIWLKANTQVKRIGGDDNCYRIFIKENAQELKKLCGTGSYNKKIPRTALLSSFEYRKKLFEGLLDTDSYIQKNGFVTYTTASKQLANDVLELVTTLGCRVSMKESYKSCQTFKEKRKYYNIYINVGKLCLEINLLRKKRLDRLRKLNLTDTINLESQYEIVRMIKTSKKSDSYCIEVNSESNLYITDNFSITHNSTIAMQISYYLAWLLAGGKMKTHREGTKWVMDGMIKPKKPVRFNLHENVVFSADALMETAQKLDKKYGKNQVILYDEGRQGLDSARAMESINKGMQDFFQECGVYGHIIIIVLPSFFKLHEDYAVSRSLFLVDSFHNKQFKRGYFNFYNEQAKEKLFYWGKRRVGTTAKYMAANENFWGRFYKWLPFDKDEYEQLKKEEVNKKRVLRRERNLQLQKDILVFLLNKHYKVPYSEIKQKMFEVADFQIAERTIGLSIERVNDIIAKSKGYG